MVMTTTSGLPLNLSYPTVSVVLPCYNAESVVPAAIESVVNSTIAPSCELIIVNDGSTDGSRCVIEATCEHIRNMRIRVIETQNQGVSKARNAALDVAEGKYIAFLDADDCISPCMLECMVAFSEERGADFSCCGLTSDLARLCKSATTPVALSKDEIFSKLLYCSASIGFTSVLYRRETIEECSLRFDETIRYGEDLAFLWKYALNCSAFISFNKPYYFYARDNEASAMHHIRWEMVDVLRAIEQIRAYIPRKEIALQKSYDEYMIPRYVLFLQKGFAMGNNRKLFDRLKAKYPSLSYRAVIRRARPVIKAIAVLYSFSPSLYFRLFQMIG